MAKHMQTMQDGPSWDDTPVEVPVRKRHRIFDHKILVVFLMFGLYLALSIAVTLAIVALQRAGIIPSLDAIDADASSTVASIVTSLLMLLLFRIWFRGEFRGILGWTTAGFVLSLPILTFCIPNFYDIGEALIKGDTVNPIPYCLFMALSPGISEEVIFRAINVSNWMRLGDKGRDIVACTLFTSLFFALAHGLNILGGAAVSSTIFQLFYAFCTGVGFCAVVLRTGSLWPSIIAHTLIDLTGMMTMDRTNMGIISEELVYNTSFYLAVAVSIVVLVYGLYLIRPSRHDEIRRVWAERWRRA